MYHHAVWTEPPPGGRAAASITPIGVHTILFPITSPPKSLAHVSRPVRMPSNLDTDPIKMICNEDDPLIRTLDMHIEY